jgi:glutamate dehydrogenase/leucine dehydrogenase
MSWIVDTYSVFKGYTCNSVVTGKPVEIGGSLGRLEATSRGCVFTLQEAAKVLNLDLTRCSAAIQGFGNVGYHCATLLKEMGVSVIAVSNSKGGVVNPKGLDPQQVDRYRRENGVMSGYPEGEDISNKELLELPCDILVLAALEGQVTRSNAGEIKARVIVEGANGPTSPFADSILTDNNVFVIPDILANAGGVTVSYFEWAQNVQRLYWTETDVNRRLNQVMSRAFHEVHDMAVKRKVPMRTAAYILAIGRVGEAKRLRGIFP